MRVCMFIDGLDEYGGDEDCLMDAIHLISHAPGTEICVSSRPEEIFRQGFAASPKLRLQDLNYPDIQKATILQLVPAFEARVDISDEELLDLILEMSGRSQGIFLWAFSMTKDLKTRARRGSTMRELRGRLEHTPDTIDGFYEDMLGRLDRDDLRDAGRYFQHLLSTQE
ncbi:MAG: hypothetical protein L6R41_000593 [Letrouitia leprolyta]|nr:MAG: hypothetical protein L6R41_000593 [Letrouitia leprolyta]